MKLISRLTAIIAAGAIAVSQAAFISATEEPETDEKTYCAFGDSIPAGYGLAEDELSYPELLASELHAKLTNYSVSGMTTDDFIKQIDEMGPVEADYITISIGSNNILKPFQEVICETAGVSKVSELDAKIAELYGEGGITGLANLSAFFTSLKTALTDNEKLNAACDKFVNEDFPAVIDIVCQTIDASESKAFFTNIYNPYYGVDISFMGTSYLPLGQLADGYIQKMNKAFETEFNCFEYADVYTAMNVAGMTNVNVSTENIADFSFDPHPNAAGHKNIAEFLASAIEDRQIGDVYYDGVVDLKDLIRFMRIMARFEEFDEHEGKYLDINCDSLVDIRDLSRLMKYVAKVDKNLVVA